MGVNLEDILGNKNEHILEDTTKKQMDRLMLAIAIIVIIIVIVVIQMFFRRAYMKKLKFAQETTAELDAIALQVRTYYELHLKGDPDYEEFIGKSQEEEDDKKRVKIERENQTVEYKYGWYFVSQEEMNEPKLLGANPLYKATSKKGYAVNYEAAIQTAVSDKAKDYNNYVVYLDGVKDLKTSKMYYEHIDIKLVAAEKTPARTFYINSVEDLAKLQDSKNWDGRFVLNSDIDMSKYTGDWIPVGNEKVRFNGTFDGKGYKIENFRIEKPNLENAGFFGYVGSEAFVNNLVMIDSEVSGGKNTGVVAAVFEGTITNSKISGHSSSGTVENAGGIFGTFAGTANNILCSVNVNGKEQVGGFAGDIEAGTMVNVYIRPGVNVRADGTSAGGFAGVITARAGKVTIDKCFSKANVSAVSGRAGGFVGVIYAQSSNYNNKIDIIHSYANGSIVTCPSKAGGFIGEVNAEGATFSVTNSYAYTKVNDNCLEYRGGFIGFLNPNGSNFAFTNAYWIKEALSTDETGKQLAGVGNERNENQYLESLPTSFSINDLNSWSDGSESWILNQNAPLKATIVGEPTDKEWKFFDTRREI